MRLATVADVEAAMAKPPLTETQEVLVARMERKRGREAMARTIASMVEDVAAGIRVFNDRGETALTDVQIYERSRNIVTGLIGNYVIEGERP